MQENVINLSRINESFRESLILKQVDDKFIKVIEKMENNFYKSDQMAGL